MRLLCALLASGIAAAQPAPDAAYRQMLESRREVTEYLERTARSLTDQAAAEIASRDSWEKVRARRVEEMRDMLGLLPWPQRTPLNVRVTGTLDKGAYTIEKIAFESLPKFYVTGNLYIPKKRSGAVPGIIYVCGHAYSPHGDKTQYQRHGISFAKNGYAAFILDSIQIAETFGLHHGIHSQEMFDWYSRGYTPAGVEVWNAMRAIDYLETRPEVDKNRIGMTGRSGGAAMSWFTAAVDPRIQVAAPVMGISTYAANVRDNTQKLHCDCMFPVNAHRHDMLHQGALIAPRPLLMMHGREDRLFPVAGYEEFEQRVGDLYKSFGVGEAFGNVVVDTGHKDSDYLRERAIRWFDKHLMKVAERKLDMDYSDAPPEQLSVFGGSPPADAINFRIQESFTTRAAPGKFASLSAWESRKTQLLAEVRKLLPQQSGDGVTIRTEVRKPKQVDKKLPGLLYIASDGEDLAYINDLLRGASRLNESIRMIVWPRGVGEVPWPRSFWKDTLRNAMHTGQTVDSMRLRDVLAAFQQLRETEGVDPERIMVVGKGVSGAIGLYAAILDPRVHQAMLMDPPSSHREGPIFLNIMRHTDLPEAAALLAPRRLNFYGQMPPAFEYTRHVYQLHGKPEHLFVAMNIEYVLMGRYDHNMASGL
ncbi:MAG: acetylxylan esterase [Bryobacteraceae bacterium]